MTTFQNSFVNLDNTNPQFQFISTDSPSTNSSNPSEDACSVNQTFLENFDCNFNSNLDKKDEFKVYESNCDSNISNSQNCDSSDADIDQLIEFVDKIECEFENEQKLKLNSMNSNSLQSTNFNGDLNQSKFDNLNQIYKSSKINETNEKLCAIKKELRNVVDNYDLNNIDQIEDDSLHNHPTIDIKLKKSISNDQVSNQIEVSDNHLSALGKHIPRPPNSFMIFGKQNRKILANQFPDYTNKQISKILGDEWRKMNLEEKQHFHRLADEGNNR